MGLQKHSVISPDQPHKPVGTSIAPEAQVMHASVIVIGAGPAGITAAYELSKQGKDFILLEKESQIGGISKTVSYKGFRFDLGGHRFFSKNSLVNEIWHKVLGKDFLLRKRQSRIYYNKAFFDYPLKPFNVLKGLGFWNSVLIFSSYLHVTYFPPDQEETFEDWVTKRFGKRLFKTFFKSYTEKLWGISCKEIRAEWAAQRIKGLSLFQALKNALVGAESKPSKIKTLISSFHYPRLGPGMMWEAMAEIIRKNGGKIFLNTNLQRICCQNERVITVEGDCNGEKIQITGDYVISTIPLGSLIQKFTPQPPTNVTQAAENLRYRDFITISLIINAPNIFPDNWIYVHDPDVKLARIQNYKNWSPSMVPDMGKTCLGLEYFCFENDDFWCLTDEKLIEIATEELVKLGFSNKEDIEDGMVIRVPKAYPIYDSNYQNNLTQIRKFIDTTENLQVIGRNGTHRYNNMDHSMLGGIYAVKNVIGEMHDLWQINEDKEYLEEGKFEGTEYISDEALINAFRRLDKIGFATGLGVVCGLYALVGIALIQFHGDGVGKYHLQLLSNFFPGFQLGWKGTLLGAGYFSFWGFLFGWLFAYLRNFFFSIYIYNVKRKIDRLTINDFVDHFY